MPMDLDELRQELEDIQEQLKLIGEERNIFRQQVNRVLPFSAGRNSEGGNSEEREHDGSKILWFSGLDRGALRGWMEQVAIKIADKPKKFTTE